MVSKKIKSVANVAKSKTAVSAASTKVTSSPVENPKVVDAVTELAGQDAAPDKADGPLVVKRKELVDRIADKSGKKPNVIKSVLDEVLRELGDILSAGEALQVQPFGKISVTKQRTLPDGEILICRVRRKKPIEKIAEPAADIVE